MSSRLPITIRIDHFEGPLDLLLYLIQSHELDISKIAISKITDQYLGFVKLMQELNFDLASEFLVMAATLIYWKSKSLLPKENQPQATEEETDLISEEELLRRLREHQLFLAAGDHLNTRPLLGDSVFVRENPKPPVEKVWKELNVSQLTLSFQDTLVKARKRTKVLRKETVSLSEKIIEFGTKLSIGKLTELKQLITVLGSKPETVVAFLASLELARIKKLRVHQEGTYTPIYLELLQHIGAQDLQLAQGFESEIQTLAEQPL